ncbi:MAG TPA: hypothetical protein VK996_16975 [Ramlibacter sp.]|nr:hypothetical protein [Ramlibacter sp.]
MNLQATQSSAQLPIGLMVPPPGASGFGGVVLRHLKTAAEVESVMHLREEIDLSVHASASSHFGSLEKKETNWGLSSHSSSMAT